MKIVEEFLTLQAEGKFLGVPSYFIRSTGCNLRCQWLNKDGSTTKCDTEYTSFKPEAGYNLDIDKVLTFLKEQPVKHIVITGGEPTIQKDIVSVTDRFLNNGYTVTIETNGTAYHEWMSEHAFMSFSPKLKSSYAQTSPMDFSIHSKNNNFIDSINKYIQTRDYQMKFVVNSQEDLEEILDLQTKIGFDSNKVYLMPQGITTGQFKDKEKWIFQQCIDNGFNYTPRMHIEIWGNKRGI